MRREVIPGIFGIVFLCELRLVSPVSRGIDRRMALFVLGMEKMKQPDTGVFEYLRELLPGNGRGLFLLLGWR